MVYIIDLEKKIPQCTVVPYNDLGACESIKVRHLTLNFQRICKVTMTHSYGHREEHSIMDRHSVTRDVCLRVM